MLTDISKQVVYHGKKRKPDAWKIIATATLNSQEIVPNLDNDGFIAIGESTSGLGKKKFSDLIEIIYMIGARFDVVWSEHAKDVYNKRHD